MFKKIMSTILFCPEIILYLLNLVLNWHRENSSRERALKLKVKNIAFYGSYMDVGNICLSYQSMKRPIKVRKGLFSTKIIIGKGRYKSTVYANKMEKEEVEAVEAMLNSICDINEHKENNTHNKRL